MSGGGGGCSLSSFPAAAGNVYHIIINSIFTSKTFENLGLSVGYGRTYTMHRIFLLKKDLQRYIHTYTYLWTAHYCTLYEKNYVYWKTISFYLNGH